jgi:HNH endonuclease
MQQSTVARFWEKVDQQGPVPVHRPDLGPCWIWLGAPNEGGYGTFWHEDKKRFAHRFSYELFIAPIPDELVIDHLCRNRICVNPDHLEPVTDRVNVLRGIGPAARNVVAVECHLGHPYDEINTYWYPDGSRGCRECRRQHVKAWREKYDPPSGAGKGSWQKAKTHCPEGHLYDEVNTRYEKDGGRRCRTCERTRNRESQRRRRAAAKAQGT